MDVVGYFKTSSALAKWKLRPAQPENYFMSVDEGGGFVLKAPTKGQYVAWSSPFDQLVLLTD